MQEIPLIAALRHHIGTLTISNDAETIVMRYRIDVIRSALLYDLHAHVALDYESGVHPQIQGGPRVDIPHVESGMLPGQFAQHCATTGVIEHTFTFPIHPRWRAAGTVWCAAHGTAGDSLRATRVVSAVQGPKRNGQPIAPDRSDPSAALEPDCPADWAPGQPSTWFSLGAGGHIIVDFGQELDAVQYPRLMCWEVTFGKYTPGMAIEKARVDVALDSEGPWVPLLPEPSSGRPESTSLVTATSVEVVGVSKYRYARVTDTSGMVVDPSLASTWEDGFDLDGICVQLPDRETVWALSGETVGASEGTWGRPFSYTLT